MKPSRRRFFTTVGAGAVGLGLPGARASAAPAGAKTAADADAPLLQVGEDVAVVETTNGKVRGYVLRGIHHFLGMPYGADTSGDNRFMPPQKPKPWTDVYPALWWGNSAPQSMDNRYQNKHASFRDHWNYDDVSEDCLRINVFTPATGDGKKRPVLFWLHGGGFTNGNGIEHDGYNGENLARSGDVVFCSINHRLGPLGFCNLAGVGGPAFMASGNVGMLDCVAALEWVRDNIARFGGDPANVTIMGQSGGGAKVTTLTAMPSARGLFHKAVVLSGAQVRAGEKEYTEKLGAAVLAGAGLERGRHREAAGDAVEGALRDRHQGTARGRGGGPGREPQRGRVAAGLRPVGRRLRAAAAPVRARGGAHGRDGPDDHLLDLQRAVARVDGRVAHVGHAAAGRGQGAGARRLRARLRRQGAGGRGLVREGVPRQEAGRDLVARHAATARAS